MNGSGPRPRPVMFVPVALKRLVGAPLVLALALLAPASARATVLHVSPAGSDVAPGIASAPLKTISRAALLARSGDVVLVAAGRYAETVDLPRTAAGVIFRAATGERPVITGDGARDFGFTTSERELSDVTIEGFELRDQGEAAISVRGPRITITDNVIHHVGADGRLDAYGIHVSYGAGVRVLGNQIYSIGPGGQATGILMTTLRDATVAGNEIRMVRKEGIRDSWGLDNVIRDNAISLCWTGLSFNTSTGSVATGNYLHDNVQGFNPKHVSEPRVVEYWKLGQPRLSRFADNTVFRSADSSVALAINAPELDYLELRGNVISGAGGAFVADAPWSRGSHVTLNGNFYAAAGGRPAWAYHTGYDFLLDGLTGLTDMRSALGWEADGRWDVATTPRVSGISPAGSTLARGEAGRSYGATAPVAETMTWTPLPMRAIASSSPATRFTMQHLDETADGVHHTYWMTETNRDEWVSFDFGGPQTFQQLLLDVYASDDKRNVRGYRFEVSDDNRAWRTVLAGTNPDAMGSSYKYELPAPVTARYLRFTLVDTFCDSYAPRTGCGESFVLADLQAGLLERVDVAPAPGTQPVTTVTPSPTPPSTTPPTASATAVATATPAPTTVVPVSAAVAPRLRLGRDAVRRGRAISVAVVCEAALCEGVLTLTGSERGKQSFALSRGTHVVTVTARAGRRSRLRAVIRAQIDGQSARAVRLLRLKR